MLQSRCHEVWLEQALMMYFTSPLMNGIIWVELVVGLAPTSARDPVESRSTGGKKRSGLADKRC